MEPRQDAPRAGDSDSPDSESARVATILAGLHPNTDLASLVGRVRRDNLRWLVVPTPALAAWERRDPAGWANVLRWLETKGVTIVPA